MYRGGYLIIDASKVSLAGAGATVVTDSKMADALRRNTKPVVVFENVNVSNLRFTMCSVTWKDTGAVDGKVYNIVDGNNTIAVSTDDDTVTFTIT